MSQRALHLSDELAAQMLGAAARAFPLECCGLIEGIRIEGGWRVTALHEAANLAEDPARRFLIDPQRQFDLMRALRACEDAKPASSAVFIPIRQARRSPRPPTAPRLLRTISSG